MCWVTPVSSGVWGAGHQASQLQGSQSIAPRGPGHRSQSPGGAGETAWLLKGGRWARDCPAAAIHWLAWPKGSTTAHQSLRPKGTHTHTHTHAHTRTHTHTASNALTPNPDTQDGNPLDKAWGRKHGSWADSEPQERGRPPWALTERTPSACKWPPDRLSSRAAVG